MKKLIFMFSLMVAALAGCTQHSVPETAYFKGQKHEVRAEVEPGAFDGLFKVYIDEELVINQRSKAFGGSSQTFVGSWKGMPVTARATAVQKMMSQYTIIDIFVDGQLIETLTV